MLPHYTAEQVAFIRERKERITSWKFIGSVPEEVVLIDRGEGSLRGCLRNLKMLHEEIADYAWFAEQDLLTFKLHSYVVAKFTYMIAKTTAEEGVMHEAEYFYALLSDNESVIRWMMSQPPHSKLFKQRVINPNQNEYCYYQLTLALNAKWDELGRKAEVFLQEPPVRMKKYSPDMRFYLVDSPCDSRQS